MRRELSKADVERLFVAAVDGSLPDEDVEQFNDAMQNDVALKSRYETYQRTVKLLRGQPRVQAPLALASVIMRRTKRRRSMMHSLKLHEVNLSRVPAEVLIPLLLAAAVALFLMTASP